MKAYIFVFLLIIFFTGYFGTFELPYALTTIILWCFVFLGYKYSSPYKTAFWLMLIGMVCSFASCQYFRGQSYIDSFKAIPEYFGILLYFFLKYKKYSLSTVEKALFFLIVFFDLVNIFQYILLPTGLSIVGTKNWSFGEGVPRIRTYASGLSYLGIFMGMTKFFISKERKYLVIFFMGLVMLLLTGYRQLILSCVLVFLFYFFTTKSISKEQRIKYAIFISFLVFIISFLPIFHNVVNSMIERQNDGQSFANSDYIRYIQLDYFFYHHFKSPLEFFFGSGVPYFHSSYGNFFYDEMIGVGNWFDWAFLGQTWVLGYITVTGFLLFVYKAMKLKVGRGYRYVSLWYLFLLLSVTNFEFFRESNFLIHALVIYIVELAHKEYNYNENRNFNITSTS